MDTILGVVFIVMLCLVLAFMSVFYSKGGTFDQPLQVHLLFFGCVALVVVIGFAIACYIYSLRDEKEDNENDM